MFQNRASWQLAPRELVAAHCLVRLGDDVVSGLTRLGTSQRVEEAGRLHHPAQPGKNMQVRTRVTTEDEKKHVAELPPRGAERNAGERAAKRDDRLAQHIGKGISRMGDGDAVLESRQKESLRVPKRL